MVMAKCWGPEVPHQEHKEQGSATKQNKTQETLVSEGLTETK